MSGARCGGRPQPRELLPRPEARPGNAPRRRVLQERRRHDARSTARPPYPDLLSGAAASRLNLKRRREAQHPRLSTSSPGPSAAMAPARFRAGPSFGGSLASSCFCPPSAGQDGDGMGPQGGWTTRCGFSTFGGAAGPRRGAPHPLASTAPRSGGACWYGVFREWSRRQESNLRPSDYKSDALPTELRRPGPLSEYQSGPALLAPHRLSATARATVSSNRRRPHCNKPSTCSRFLSCWGLCFSAWP